MIYHISKFSQDDRISGSQKYDICNYESMHICKYEQMQVCSKKYVCLSVQKCDNTKKNAHVQA